MVMGWATEKRTRRVMFSRRNTLEMTAMTSWMALMAMSLQSQSMPASSSVGRPEVQDAQYHGGSLTKWVSVISVPGGMRCLHGRTSAQMLKALATGPRVPAIMGNADDANHQRLGPC